MILAQMKCYLAFLVLAVPSLSLSLCPSELACWKTPISKEYRGRLYDLDSFHWIVRIGP